MSSVTDTIRAMLDERGVEHFDSTGGTYWGGSVLARNGFNSAYRFSAREGVCGLNVNLLSVTPEQAIEATLGRGECRITVQDNLAETDGMGDVWLECDACQWQMTLEPSTPRFNYCPNCGRKVRA